MYMLLQKSIILRISNTGQHLQRPLKFIIQQYSHQYIIHLSFIHDESQKPAIIYLILVLGHAPG